MKKVGVRVAASLLALALSPAWATTWGDSKVLDPVTKTRISVHEPMSSGSYIYQWPEKSDQVFWPYTDPHWLWFNPKSGYVAFGDDFEKIAECRTGGARHHNHAAGIDRDRPLAFSGELNSVAPAVTDSVPYSGALPPTSRRPLSAWIVHHNGVQP